MRLDSVSVINIYRWHRMSRVFVSIWSWSS